jgi:hypothetical protein
MKYNPEKITKEIFSEDFLQESADWTVYPTARLKVQEYDYSGTTDNGAEYSGNKIKVVLSKLILQDWQNVIKSNKKGYPDETTLRLTHEQFKALTSVKA